MKTISNKKPGNNNINEAPEFYNPVLNRLQLEKRIMTESEIIKEDSMNVLKEFEKLILVYKIGFLIC